jgi:hypothetical protein
VIRRGTLRVPTEMDEKAIRAAAIFSWGRFSQVIDSAVVFRRSFS